MGPHAYRPAYGGYAAPSARYSYHLAPAPAPVAAPAPAPYYAQPAPAPVAAPLKAVPAVPYAEPAYVAEPAPVAVPAPAPSSQYHAQDEYGNVSYGYKNPNSAKDEKRDEYGNVVGSYSYVDATGVPKHLSYVADDYGYRVTATNALPV